MGAAAVIDLDLGSDVVNVGGWRLPLASLERLWSVVAVLPGVPDEAEQRWVVQTRDGIALAAALNLPSQAHVDALGAWAQSCGGIFRLRRVGWPWRWGTLGWAWCAMRRGSGQFSLAVWDAVRQGGEETGPLGLVDVLRDE
ncbi:hypothetical protein EIP75_00635 [Aquabacterium soli]|uniref:Uncharacterized protein n=1 Tax=Aquabacterium soli TaxID=2493092 RepID=A0A426VGW5_9BURK|nr:hypothetical protein [Aquabacterium soli]RRS06142.1 hypothetical protein EIP75_00635 [Aquabacterium soli]